MKWTPQQDKALTEVEAWLNDSSRQVFKLFGYAGTGKTTLAKHLVENSGLRVAFAAYTGKAALVMRRNGCTDATTIHALIYRAIERSREKLEKLLEQLEAATDPREVEVLTWKIENERAELAKLSFKRQPNALDKIDLVVIDECSMIDEHVGIDLLDYRKKILVLGDPGQLPPVNGGGFFTQGRPDVMLTDVQRQARDNPIIELATRVRNGDALRVGDYGSSRVIERADINIDDILDASQLLVGYNATRRGSNTRIRQALGRDKSPLPVAGDRLVCLRNDHDLGLLNGALYNTVEDAKPLALGEVLLKIQSDDDGTEHELAAHTDPFYGQPISLPWWERKNAHEFDYGYALTVHKSQGSQWENVVLLDEWTRADSRRRWLYTGVTRAQDRITIVKM